MLFWVLIILLAGVVAVGTFYAAVRAGAFQKRIRQNGLAVYNRGVQELVEQGHLYWKQPPAGGEADRTDQPVKDAAE